MKKIHHQIIMKTFNSIFRKNNIPVFCHAAFNLIELPKKEDVIEKDK